MIAPDAHLALKDLRDIKDRIEHEYKYGCNPIIIARLVERLLDSFEKFPCLRKVRQSIYEMQPDNNDQPNILQSFDSLVEYKIGEIGKNQLTQYIIHVYEYSRKTLLFGNNGTTVQSLKANADVLDIYYDGDSGVFTIQGYEEPENFDPKSIEGKLLSFLTPGGKPCRDPIPLEDARDGDICDIGKPIKAQNNCIDKARNRINEKLEAKFGKQELLRQEKGHLFWNKSNEYKY